MMIYILFLVKTQIFIILIEINLTNFMNRFAKLNKC